jgi:hypothetical protein
MRSTFLTFSFVMAAFASFSATSANEISLISSNSTTSKMVGDGLVVITEVCDGATEVRMTGPWWGWNPSGGPVAADNGDGTWTFTLAPAPTENMEYLLVVNGVQENLIPAMVDGGDCAPITDYATYANRQWLTSDPMLVNTTFGQCSSCEAQTDLVITTEVCEEAAEVRLTGPWWSWDLAGGPIAADNGDGTWSFTFSPAPTEDMEYLLIVDGVQEDLIAAMADGGDCAPLTDFATYANRQWATTDNLNVSNTYGQCTACVIEPVDLIMTTDVCEVAADVRMTGPWWGWDPAAGPIAADNGDGTWTFTFSPAPTEDMEYLLVVDGVQENLIAAMADGGDCAPITDFATYANRQWMTTDGGMISNTYGQCTACDVEVMDLIITTEVCDDAAEVRMTGPWWGWDPAAGPIAADNGDGTWTFTFAPAPTENMEYILIVDGIQEDLIAAMVDGGDCAPITDFATYANRQWMTTDGMMISNTYGQCTACEIEVSDLIITTEVCDEAAEVRMTGPWWGWDPAAGPIAADNGDGTWTFTFAPAPTENMEYLLVVDGVQEDLIADMVNGGDCAPLTDFSTYANRQWLTTDDLMISNTYGQCAACDLESLMLTIEVCDVANEVRMTGPFWGWDITAGPIAVDNGDGTWSVTMTPAPTENMEYLFVVDGVQENLISAMQNGGDCAPITDYFSYANRLWTVGSEDVNDIAFGRCVPCSYPDITIVTEICTDGVTSVNLTGPIWNWDTTLGPQATDNGDGTWTFNIAPIPTDSLEYLFVVNGVQENLISAMQDGGECAPITDFDTFASRLYLIGDGDISNTYGQCTPCIVGLEENNLNNITIFPNPASDIVHLISDSSIDQVILYNILGSIVQVNNVNNYSCDLDVSQLAPGLYQIRTISGTAQSVQQISIK